MRTHPGLALVALAIAAFLVTFLIVPVANVIWVAFSDGHGHFTLAHFQAFAGISLMRESLPGVRESPPSIPCGGGATP